MDEISYIHSRRKENQIFDDYLFDRLEHHAMNKEPYYTLNSKDIRRD